MLLRVDEMLLRFLYKPIWRLFEAIHNCMVGTWDWIVEKLSPFAWAVFSLTIVLLFLIVVLRSCFQ